MQMEVSPGLGTQTGTSEPCSCRPAALPPGLFGWLRNATRADVSPGPGGETWRVSTARAGLDQFPGMVWARPSQGGPAALRRQPPAMTVLAHWGRV